MTQLADPMSSATAALGRLREKYPQYAQMGDQELASRVAAKYPEYRDHFAPLLAAPVLAPTPQDLSPVGPPLPQSPTLAAFTQPDSQMGRYTQQTANEPSLLEKIGSYTTEPAKAEASWAVKGLAGLIDLAARPLRGIDTLADEKLGTNIHRGPELIQQYITGPARSLADEYLSPDPNAPTLAKGRAAVAPSAANIALTTLAPPVGIAGAAGGAYDRAHQAGASDAEAATSAGVDATLNTALLPIGGSAGAKTAVQFLKETPKKAAIGAALGGGTRFAQNVADRLIYNPKQDLTEGVAEGAAMGALFDRAIGATHINPEAAAAQAARKSAFLPQETTNAPAVREDAGQVPVAGPEPTRGQDQGGQDLQRAPEARPSPGDAGQRQQAEAPPEVQSPVQGAGDAGGEDAGLSEPDTMLNAVTTIAREKGGVSPGMLLRQIGMPRERAEQVLGELERQGVLGPADSKGAREVVKGVENAPKSQPPVKPPEPEPVTEMHSGIPLPGAGLPGSQAASAPGEPSGWQIVKESLTNAYDALNNRSLPRIARSSKAAADAGVRYASADVAVPLTADSLAGHVLGNRAADPTFDRQLGAALAEDRLRAIRDSYTTRGDATAAGKVKTIVGAPESPFPDEASYQAFLSSPEGQRAIEAHKQIVEPEMLGHFQQAAPGAALASPGKQTGAFLSLNPIDPDAAGKVASASTAKAGRLTNPFRKKPQTARQATGAGDYELSYRANVESALKRNYEIAQQNRFYDELTKSGDAVIGPPQRDAPVLKGEKTTAIPIMRKTLVVNSDGETTVVPKNENIYVRNSLMPEARAALNVDAKAKPWLVGQLATQASTKTGVEAYYHIKNLFRGVTGAPGGENLLMDLGPRAMPVVKKIDTIARVLKSRFELAMNDQGTKDRLARLGQIGALRAEAPNHGFMGRAVETADRATRLTLDKMFDNLVNRGLAENSETARREYVAQVGQYNRRLQSDLARWVKDKGFGSFVTAGKTFNAQGVRALTGSPMVDPASAKAAAQLRAIQFARNTAIPLATAATVNYLLWGKMTGRNGVPIGAIDTGKDDERGRPISLDLASETGTRRGTRVTGAGAVAEGIRQGKTTGETTEGALADVISSQMHPYTGPLPQAAVVAASGRELAPNFPQKADIAPPGESQIPNRLKAAAGEVFPGGEAVVDILKDRERTQPQKALDAAKAIGSQAIDLGPHAPYNPDAVHGRETKDFIENLASRARREAKPGQASDWASKEIMRLFKAGDISIDDVDQIDKAVRQKLRRADDDALAPK